MKKLFFIFFMLTLAMQGQHTVEGTLTPNATNYNWIILYKLEGTKQVYIKNATIENDQFKVEIPEGTSEGIYRLTYDLENSGYVDIIYNQEDISLSFNPKQPEQSLRFNSSEENIVYNGYLQETGGAQHQLDSLQYTYFREKDPVKHQLIKDLYKEAYSVHANLQQDFEQKSQDLFAHHFIKSSKKYYAEELLEEPQLYLNSEKEHYFDFLDFGNLNLLKSTLISEKVIDYVFYLNSSDDYEVQNGLFKSAVKTIMSHVTEHDNVKAEITRILLIAFGQTQNPVLVEYLIENHYQTLPDTLKDALFISEIRGMLKLAIGTIAPDFSWEEHETTKTLYEHQDVSNYLVVFWSTTCSHCLNEIPQLYEFMKSNKNVKVLAIALELEDEEYKKYAEKFKDWTNILGMKKWENPIAMSYDITATPTYFVLDSSKKIISKPEFFEDVKYFFETLN